jgi:hypothetical protein
MFFSTVKVSFVATVLASLLTSISAAEAASLAPCDVLPASAATQIVGMPLRARPAGIPEAPSCEYLSQRPIFAFGLQTFSSESHAATYFKKWTASSHPTVAFRQKGVFVLSAISLNHDSSKLTALLEAAAKHL